MMREDERRPYRITEVPEPERGVSPTVKLVVSFALVVLAVAIVVWSDMYLRPAAIPGTDPRSWDIVGTIMLVIGMIGVWRGLNDRR